MSSILGHAWWNVHVAEIDRRVAALVATELPPVSNLLFHYTTVEGGIGIIESGKMWAAHFRDGGLNDSQEILYGRNLLRRLFGGELRQVAGWATPDIGWRTLRDRRRVRAWLLSTAITGLTAVQDEAPAVTSLAQFGDDEALWRRYAADGAGCVLELAASPFLRRQANTAERRFKLFPVCYRPATQRRVFRTIAEYVENQLWNHPAVHGPRRQAEQTVAEAAVMLAFLLWGYGAFCKERVPWAREHEWRFEALVGERAFDVRPNGRKKVDLCLPPGALVGVRVGPHASADAANRLEAAARAAGVVLTRSERAADAAAQP